MNTNSIHIIHNNKSKIPKVFIKKIPKILNFRVVFNYKNI